MNTVNLLTNLNSSEEKLCPFPTGTILVNLSQLKNNIKKIRRFAQKNSNNPSIKYLLPVKSNTYGHGMVAVASFIQSQNLCDYLGVAHLQEAYVLREHGISLPILIHGPLIYSDQAIEYIVKEAIEIEISDTILLKKLQHIAEQLNLIARIHLSVDTGMGRTGVLPHDVPQILSEIVHSKNIELKGVMTHFSVADESSEEDVTYTEMQIKQFLHIKELVLKQFSHQILFHSSNSAGSISYVEGLCDMVRPGIASYGYPGVNTDLSLDPVMEVTSQIALVKEFPQGHTIGYGRTYSTTRDNERIGIIPVGYGDGVFRALSNKAEMIIGGKKQPMRGCISMDQCAVSIDVDDTVGDEVVLLGRRGQISVSAEDLARAAGTISYEVLCALGNSKRLRHRYVL